MQISKRTMLLLGALVVLAVGSNLDAAGLRPDRGKGGGTRGKGGSQKKDFQKSAKNAVKALTARIRSDFNLQRGSGPQRFLEAVENGNVDNFTLLSPLNFENVKKHSSFENIKTAAGDIREQIKLLKADLAKSNTTDNRLSDIEKSASPGGNLYKKYAKFLKDFTDASLPARNVKTADEAKAEAVTDFKTKKTTALNTAKADAPTGSLKTFTDAALQTALTEAKSRYDKALSDANDAIKTIDKNVEVKSGKDGKNKADYELTNEGTIDGLITSVKAAATAFKNANDAEEKAKDDTPADITAKKDTSGNLISVSLDPAKFSNPSKKASALQWLNAKFSEADGKVTNFENAGTYDGVDYEREIALKASLADAIALIS